jgi:hypothetical protein
MRARLLLAMAVRLVFVGMVGALPGRADALSTTFTYQGQLLRNDIPVSDTCNFRFVLTDTGGSTVATTSPATLAVQIVNGLFTVPLDFGAAFSGPDRYLRILVSCPADGGVFTDLTQTQRQQLTAAPYALYAPVAGTAPPGGAAGGSLSGTYPNPSLAINSVGSSQIQDGSVASNDVGFNYAGSASKGGPASDLACSGCVAATEIASGQVVKSLNGLTNNVTLQAGSNVTITPSGNTLTVASTGGGGLSAVSHDTTLSGSGTGGSPLGVAVPLGLGTSSPSTPLQVVGRISTGSSGSSAGAITFYPPDGFAWFHIDNGPAGGRPTGRLRVSIGGAPGCVGVGCAELMSITQAGQVGIGTTTPVATLDVASGTNPQVQVEQSNVLDFARIRFQSVAQWCIDKPCSAPSPNPPWDIAVGSGGYSQDAHMAFWNQVTGNVMLVYSSGVRISGNVGASNLANGCTHGAYVCADADGVLGICGCASVIGSAEGLQPKLAALQGQLQELKKENAELREQLQQVVSRLEAVQLRQEAVAMK